MAWVNTQPGLAALQRAAQPLLGVYLPQGEMGKGKCTCGHFPFAPGGIQTWCPMLKSSDAQPVRGSARTKPCGVPCAGAWQPAVGASNLWKPPARAGSLPGLCRSLGRFGDGKLIRVHKPREARFGEPGVISSWRGTHAKCPRMHVLLLPSSLCTHFAPFWRQNLGLEGSLLRKRVWCSPPGRQQTPALAPLFLHSTGNL